MADLILDRHALGRIPIVSSSSQNTNSKPCISCRRILNYEFFGDSRTSKDGFNSYCRQCRNQKRRLHYGRSDEPYLLNLEANNEGRLLKGLFEAEHQGFLKAFSLDDGTVYQLEVKTTSFSVLFHMSEPSGKSVLNFEFLIQLDRQASLERMRRFLVQELSNRRLRLAESDDERFQVLQPH